MTSTSRIGLVISQHAVSGVLHYRVQMEDGSTCIQEGSKLRLSHPDNERLLNEFDPTYLTGEPNDEPISVKKGPQNNDILLVLIEGVWNACTILDVCAGEKGRPLYLVRYDDGMLVRDYLRVPWSYVAVSDNSSHSDAKAADSSGPGGVSSSDATVETPTSSGKAKVSNAQGKRKVCEKAKETVAVEMTTCIVSTEQAKKNVMTEIPVVSSTEMPMVHREVCGQNAYVTLLQRVV